PPRPQTWPRPAEPRRRRSRCSWARGRQQPASMERLPSNWQRCSESSLRLERSMRQSSSGSLTWPAWGPSKPLRPLKERGLSPRGELERHFGKHAKEWGAEQIGQEEYLRRARELLNSRPDGEILGATRANGDILRYNMRTNELAVGTAEGGIRTFF